MLLFHQYIRLPYKWIAVVSWLNYFILAIDVWASSSQYRVKCAFHPTLDSSTLFHIYHAASCDFCSYLFLEDFLVIC